MVMASKPFSPVPENTVGGPPRTITKMIEVRHYLVEYFDGDGKKEVRLAFTPIGAKEPVAFLHQASISGVKIAVQANEWFAKAMQERLLPKKEEKGVESV